MRRRVALPLALAFAMAGLGATASGAMAHRSAGAVYTLTNSPAGNAVKVFRTANDGSLSAAGEFPTGGTGTGTGLGSQGALHARRPASVRGEPGQRLCVLVPGHT